MSNNSNTTTDGATSESSNTAQESQPTSTPTETKKSPEASAKVAETQAAPQEFDIPEGEDFFLGKEATAISRRRVTGLFFARLSGLRSKPCTAGKGRVNRLVLRFELEGAALEPGQPNTAEYECPATWTTTSDLQRIAPKLLNRPLEKSEINGRFNAATLRGQKCGLDVTEHRSRAAGAESSVSTLIIKEIKSLDATKKALEAIAAQGE